MHPADLIDLERYPVDQLDSARAREVVRAGRRRLDREGVAILPDFVKPAALEALVREVEKITPWAHREDIAVGTPYLEPPDESFPEGHPRRTTIRSATWVVAYDLIPPDAALRALYEWDPLMELIGEVLDRRPLYRFADPLGALNAAIMTEGDCQGWHYDSTDFVVSLAIQGSREGGLFECAPMIRSDEDERYEEVARVLRGEAPEKIRVLPMVPGALMIFRGRHSLHRVSPVGGEVPRYVALLAYDTRPGADSSDLLKLVRYGRTEPIGP